ncbi:MAG: aspartate/glutamate racemase family protein [Eubacteriales bacterium]
MKIGIIGGIGPESTLDYYQLIIKAYRDNKNDGNYPEIIINSINMTKMLTFVSNNEWDKLVSYLSEAVKSVSDAGAQFAVIASNTPHMVFNEVQALSPIPILSIVEETYKYAMSLGLQKVGLLGTKFTMQSDYYQKVFERNGISVAVPMSQEQDYIHNKLMSEIELGIMLEETKNGLLSIAKRLVEDESIEGLVLGCTELPLILRNDEYGIPFLNTTRIHAERAVNYAITGK